MLYKYKSEGISPKDLKYYQNPIELFKDLRDGNINPKEILKDQINFKSDFGKMKKWNRKLRWNEQISLIQNVENVFDLREKIIHIFRDDTFLLSERKYKAKYGSGLKILNTKQTLQRLPIVLAQVKESNTSENLLNKIRQIMHSLYQEKGVTKNHITIEWIR